MYLSNKRIQKGGQQVIAWDGVRGRYVAMGARLPSYKEVPPSLSELSNFALFIAPRSAFCGGFNPKCDACSNNNITKIHAFPLFQPILQF